MRVYIVLHILKSLIECCPADKIIIISDKADIFNATLIASVQVSAQHAYNPQLIIGCGSGYRGYCGAVNLDLVGAFGLGVERTVNAEMVPLIYHYIRGLDQCCGCSAAEYQLYVSGGVLQCDFSTGWYAAAVDSGVSPDNGMGIDGGRDD